MQTLEAPTRPPRRPREPYTYTPGQRPSPTAAFLAVPTGESPATFVLPLLDRGLEVLDAGCGAGTITQSLAEHVLPGRVTAIDRDAAQVARASRLAEGRELTNVRFTTAEADALPFGDASFDLVFAHALFEHVMDPKAALREMRRVLRPGGFIALCSPDWDSFEMRQATPAAEAALQACRDLMDTEGANPRAGGQLAAWLTDAEFAVLEQGQRFENYGPAVRIATHLALQLDAAGNPGAAHALIDWSTEPGAELLGCWRHAIGMKWNR
ncbi:MAG TPA: methyltransferase domain-containing protein [Chthoniobacterales bacterium]